MRLGRWHLVLSIVVLVLVALTGVVWFVRNDLLAVEPDDMQRLALAAHGLAAYATLLVFGSVMPRHIRWAWHNRRNLTTGITFTAVMVVLMLTGLGLYYASEGLRDWSRVIHIAIGLAAVVVFPLHIVIGRRIRRRRSLQMAEVVALDLAARKEKVLLERRIGRGL